MFKTLLQQNHDTKGKPLQPVQSYLGPWLTILRELFFQSKRDKRFATQVFTQSLAGARFLSIALTLSLLYSLYLEFQFQNTPNIILTSIQIILSVSLTIITVQIKDVRKIARIFAMLMFLIAITEMETQFHDVNIDYSDAKSWLTNLGLMAAFAFFHIGLPLQFIAVWSFAFLYYFSRLMIANQYIVPKPLLLMMTTIIPLFVVWIFVNAWWFRIRHQFIEAGNRLQIVNQKLKDIDEFRSAFFAGISHEFRTPLTLILSPLNRFLHESKSIPLLSYLRSVRRNGNRLLTLVNNLGKCQRSCRLIGGTTNEIRSRKKRADFEKITESRRTYGQICV